MMEIVKQIQAQQQSKYVQPTNFDYAGDPERIPTMKEVQDFINNNWANRVIGGFQSLYDISVSLLEDNSKTKYPDVWSKHGTDVKAKAEKRKQWKTLTAADYDEIVREVRGEHLDYYGQRAYERQTSNMPVTERATPISHSAGIGDGSDYANLSDDYKRYMYEEGLSENDLRIWCERTGQKPKDFIEMVKKNPMVRSTQKGVTYSG